MDINIDIVGQCNLRCPSCPAGNSTPNKHGMMSFLLFKDICNKLISDYTDSKIIHLYNWAEPTLHPDLPLIIHIAVNRGLKVILSTNLNHRADFTAIMDAHPNTIRVSVSGFTQPIHSMTHTCGDIEIVKKHMVMLSDIKQYYKIKLEVVYHCYKNNLGSEYRQMRDYCRAIGFIFVPVIACMMPIEKMLCYQFNEQDQELVNLLLVHPSKYSSICRRNKVCDLFNNRLAINWDGSVGLCCASYDWNHNVASNFLAFSPDQIKKSKSQATLCSLCQCKNLHNAAINVNGLGWLLEARKHGRLPWGLIKTYLGLYARQILQLRPF